MTNYKCFKAAEFIVASNRIEYRLGCLDSIEEVDLEELTVCEGALDTPSYRIKCCDSGDMCNSDLTVTLQPTTTEPATDGKCI